MTPKDEALPPVIRARYPVNLEIQLGLVMFTRERLVVRQAGTITGSSLTLAFTSLPPP